MRASEDGKVGLNSGSSRLRIGHDNVRMALATVDKLPNIAREDVLAVARPRRSGGGCLAAV